jgi:integrase
LLRRAKRPLSVVCYSLRELDPLDAKKASSKSAAGRKRFGECANELIASKRSEWRSKVHESQWRTTILTYCGPILGRPVDTIDTAAVLSVLQPIWGRVPETASRVRGRIEAVLDYAKAHGLRASENPAAWRNHLALILPKRQKLSRQHHAAMKYSEIPGFLARLREHKGVASIALEFAILTAARSGEVRGALWSEIDLKEKVLAIPGTRMKAGIAHRVPLSNRTVEIIEQMAQIRTSDFVFPGQRRGRPLSGAALETVLRRMGVKDATPHGFRSSFRDWCGNETHFPREICEAALAHATGNAVEQAYRRGDALEKRRGLMETWANYCTHAGARECQ